MEINLLAVVLATIAMFAIGAFWYTVPFGKIWGTMHGMDKYSEKEMKELSAHMGPWYGLQLLMTVITAGVLAYIMHALPTIPFWQIAFLVWLGFVLPTQVSAVVFGGTEPRWMVKKITIMAGEALLHLLVAAWIISLL